MDRFFIFMLLALVTFCNVNGHKGEKGGKGDKGNCMKTSFDLLKCCKMPVPENNGMDKECLEKYKDDKKAGMMV